MTHLQPFTFPGLFAHNAAGGLLGAVPLGMRMPQRPKYDFAVSYPDPASLPLGGLMAALQEALAEEGADLALYVSSQGYGPLREFVAAKLARDRNIHVSADEVLLTSGAGQAIHITLELLVNPGDVVFTDEYVYGGALHQMRRFQADVRAVPGDLEGVLPDALEGAIQQARREGKQPKLFYTVPTFQNPQGWSMPLERRQALIGLARHYGMPILEDDCYSDLRYEGQDPPTLYTVDEGAGHVIYVNSFSKTIAPGMRTGYMTAAPELFKRAMAAKSGGPVPLFVTLAIHRFATSSLTSHIEAINDIQRQRRDAMLASLDEHFTGSATWIKPEGGLVVWVKFPADTDLTPMRDKIFAATGAAYSPGTNFAPDRVSGKNYMRLSFGFNTPAEIHEGMGLLADGLRKEGVLA